MESKLFRPFSLASLLLLLLLGSSCMIHGFVITPRSGSHPFMTTTTTTTTRLFAAEELPDISKMKAGEMKKELESYGISTKSLFEKSEFAEALKKAREEGKTPIEKNTSSEEPPINGEGINGEPPNGASSSSSSGGASREERYQKALEEAKTMKVGELKKALTDRGISTKSFFEKTEFVKAYAEAIADNKTGPGAGAAGGGQGRRAARPDEPMDPSYRDVVMQKIDRRQLIGATVIDTKAR